MAKRSWTLGLVVAVLAVGSFGCTTLRRAGNPTSVEEVDMLADVELTEQEVADAAPAPPPAAGKAGLAESRGVDVAWTPSGKNIQLAKLPPVKPVTASMLSLGKRPGRDGSLAPLTARDGARPDAGRLESDAPPRGLAKSDPSKAAQP